MRIHTYTWTSWASAAGVRSGGEQRGRVWALCLFWFSLGFFRDARLVSWLAYVLHLHKLCCRSRIARLRLGTAWSTQLLGRVLNKLMSPRAADVAAAWPRARAPAWRALLGASAWCGTAIGLSAWHHLSRAVKHCDPAQGNLRPRASFRPEVGAEPYCLSSSPQRAMVHRVVVPPAGA